MSEDAREKKILNMLKNGPKTAPEIIKELDITKKLAYKKLAILEEENKISSGFVRRERERRGVQIYFLPEHEEDIKKGRWGDVYLSSLYPPPALYSRIEETIIRLKKKLFRYPNLEEIAIETGESPQSQIFIGAVYKIAKKV